MRYGVMLLVLACGGEGAKDDSGVSPDGTRPGTATGTGVATGVSETGTTTAMTTGTTGTTGTGTTTATGSTSITSPDPADIPWTLQVNTGNPLSATASLTSPEDTTLRIAYGPTGGALTHSTPPVDVRAGVATDLWVLGLYPGEWDAAVVVGSMEGPRQAVMTQVPPSYRPTTVMPGDGAVFEPHEAICASLEEPPAYVCTDREGRPTLYIALPGNAMFVRPLSDGTFVGHPDGPPTLNHFDVIGTPLGSIGLDDLRGATYPHEWIDEHEMIEITEGAWAGAWAILTALGDRTPRDFVIGAGIVVFDPVTREVLWDWSAHGTPDDRDSIDPVKLPYGRTGVIDYGEDWLHANALTHGVDADGTDFFWMSMRHQDWVMRIDAPSGEIRWRFGYEGDFRLVDDLDAPVPSDLPAWDYMFHQHAPELRRLPDGRVEMLLLDNGNERADGRGGLREGPAYSRAALFTLDEERLEAELTWAYGEATGPQRWFSPAAGDADRMPDGEHVLVVRSVGEAFIREVAPDGSERWNQEVYEEGELYRAEFFPSLYETTWTYTTGW